MDPGRESRPLLAGDLQGIGTRIADAKAAPGSLELKAKLALVDALGSAGAESIVVAGTVRSMVTSITAAPVFDAASVATARSARFPSASSAQEAWYGAAASVPSETQEPVEQPDQEPASRN